MCPPPGRKELRLRQRSRQNHVRKELRMRAPQGTQERERGKSLLRRWKELHAAPRQRRWKELHVTRREGPHQQWQPRKLRLAHQMRSPISVLPSAVDLGLPPLQICRMRKGTNRTKLYGKKCSREMKMGRIKLVDETGLPWGLLA